MTATIELCSARRKLETALGASSQDYFNHMKLWFRKKASKEDFDQEARRILAPEHTHLHNEFLLAILNKCQTLASFAPTPGAKAAAAAAVSNPMCPTGVLAAPHQAHHHPLAPTPSSELLTPRKYDSGTDRLRRGKVKRRVRTKDVATFDQRFQPVSLINAAKSHEMTEVHAQEEQLRFLYHEPALPDSSLIQGRTLVSCWEEGLEGADEEAIKVLIIAVEHQLRSLVQGLLMQRNGYKLRDGNFPHAVGKKVANPWLLNTQRRLAGYPGGKVSDVAEALDAAYLNRLEFTESTDTLVPAGHTRFQDVEQKEIFEDACAESQDVDGNEEFFVAKRIRRPISMYDLFQLLRQQKSLIPSHSVYAVNMERIIARLQMDECEADFAKC